MTLVLVVLLLRVCVAMGGGGSLFGLLSADGTETLDEGALAAILAVSEETFLAVLTGGESACGLELLLDAKELVDAEVGLRFAHLQRDGGAGREMESGDGVGVGMKVCRYQPRTLVAPSFHLSGTTILLCCFFSHLEHTMWSNLLAGFGRKKGEETQKDALSPNLANYRMKRFMY